MEGEREENKLEPPPLKKCCTINRDSAEGGAGGALASPLFCKNKNKFNKK